MGEDAKESAKMESTKRVSNEQLLEKMEELITRIEIVQLDVEELKKRNGFRDKPIGMPSRQNLNTDPGPWKMANVNPR
jgi:hypothetical protein